MTGQETTKGKKMRELVKRDWLWSLRPFFTCFKWLGVDLFVANRLYETNRWFFVYRLFFLLLTIGSQVACLFYVFRNAKQFSNNYTGEHGFNSDALTWNAAMDFVNYAFHSIGCHLVLLFFFRAQWILLVKSFQRLESSFSGNDFVAIRKASIAAVLYVVVVHILWCMLVTKHYKSDESPFAVIFFSWLSIIYQVYPITSLALFVVISYASSYAYEIIRTDLKRLRKREKDEHCYAHLFALKNYHLLVCETTDHINDCFGWILIISIPYYLVTCITSSFYLFGKVNYHVTVMDAVYFTFHIFHLVLICYAADFIRDQADSVLKELIKWKTELVDPNKTLIDGFLSQVALFSPQVSALGYLHVSKRMLPQVLATTLTYFLILYQFQSTEKELKGD